MSVKLILHVVSSTEKEVQPEKKSWEWDETRGDSPHQLSSTEDHYQVGDDGDDDLSTHNGRSDSRNKTRERKTNSQHLNKRKEKSLKPQKTHMRRGTQRRMLRPTRKANLSPRYPSPQLEGQVVFRRDEGVE